MGRFGNFLLQNFQVTQTPKQLMELAAKLTDRKLLLIEAGGHNGRDTRGFLMNEQIRFAYVFEPDLGNSLFFKDISIKYKNRMSFNNLALSDECGWADFYLPELSGGGFLR
jgi:hypothetical protein